MKTLKFILSIVLTSVSLSLSAQTDQKTTDKIVADKQYTFVANSANPMGSLELNKALSSLSNGQGSGRINLLGSGYEFKVSKDSLIAYLPYYGRSYSAPINPTEGGIKFTSKNFSYKETKNKKGNYTISIKTNDLNNENYNITLSISAKGYASLTATSNNKQPINFDGVLEDPNAKKK